MQNARNGVELHLLGGIPVVELDGEWNEQADALLAETVNRLAQAGHYEIIVNLLNARHLPKERAWLDQVERLAATVRKHCGRLDIVATMEQIQCAARRQARFLIHWATSEEQALCHILGVPVTTVGRKLAMRLAPSGRAGF